MPTQHEDEGPRRRTDQLGQRWLSLADDVRRRVGPGAGLEPGMRAAFEGRLGGDLSSVMVHRSPLAGRLARSLGAEALSTGGHLLGDDGLDPATSHGVGVLGHELMHVVQRDMQPDTAEAEAQVVERALAGDNEAPAGAGSAPLVDADALAERVYQRLMDQLRREQDRAAWIA